MKLITYVGISGSGKSRLTKQFEAEGYLIISPDALRKKLTGDVSDQSQNERVFRIAIDALVHTLGHTNVVFDATNLRESSLKVLLKHARFYNAEVVVYVMMDSLQPAVCKSRIELDLKKGTDRAHTAEDSILAGQYQKFLHMNSVVDSLLFMERESVIRYESSL